MPRHFRTGVGLRKEGGREACRVRLAEEESA